MNRQSFQNAIDRLLAETPFRPFTIETVTGTKYEIDHPSAVATRDGTAIYILPGGVPVWFDGQSVASIIGDITGRKSA